MVREMEANVSLKDKSKIGVYLVTNPTTGETYVGSGLLWARFKVHSVLLEKGRHWNRKLQKAYNRNPNFQFIGIEVSGDRKAALEVEQAIIAKFHGHALFLNIAKDVERPMLGFRHSAETIEKNRIAGKLKWSDPRVREMLMNAARAGRDAMTEENRVQFRKSVSEGLKRSYEEGRRVSNAGQKRSEEFCRRNSENIRNRWEDAEYRERQRLGRIGKMYRPPGKIVIGDGIEYPSLTDAAKALDVSKQSVKYRIESKNFPNWNYKEST